MLRSVGHFHLLPPAVHMTPVLRQILEWVAVSVLIGTALIMLAQKADAADTPFVEVTPLVEQPVSTTAPAAPDLSAVTLTLTLPENKHVVDGAALRRDEKARTITLLLNGFGPANNEPQGLASLGIPTGKKALSGFFKQHLSAVKEDLFGKDDPNRLRVVAGEESFTSRPLNNGINMEPAKMVGMTLPINSNTTLGAGYTWGEKNPALMLRTAEGFMAGVSTKIGKTDVQVSYLTSGQEIMGFEIGGQDVRYDSIMVGTSFRVAPKLGLTATAQLRKDNDPLTTGDNQAIFTVGTKWRF